MVTLLTRVQSDPGFDKQSKLAIIGQNFEKVYKHQHFGKDNMYRMNVDWMIDEWRNNFIKYYGGFVIYNATDVEKFFLAQTDEFKVMNIYPYAGSIKKIDNYIVVKMSDKLNPNACFFWNHPDVCPQ